MSVAELEALVESSTQQSDLRNPWPADLVALVRSESCPGLIEAYQRIGRSALVGVLESVRNRLLDFVLQLEHEHPEILSVRHELAPSQKAVVADVFITNVQGDNCIVAVSADVRQWVEITWKEGDLDSLLEHLRENHVPQENIRSSHASLGSHRIRNPAPSSGPGEC